MLLISLAARSPIQGQRIARPQLVGTWVAVELTEGSTFIVKDGDTIHFNGRPAYNVTINFKADNHGFLRWGDSAKARSFVYRMINSKLIEITFTGKKTWRHTFTIIGNKLYLGEYPIPKKPQESIDILYTLTFVKQL